MRYHPSSFNPRRALRTGTRATEGGSLSRKPLSTEHINIWIGIVITLAAIILFISGQGFREGYLSGFGVDISQASVGFHETLYWGYLANLSRELLFLLAISISFMLFGMLGVGIEWSIKKLRQRFYRTRQMKRRNEIARLTKQRSIGNSFILAGFKILLSIYVLVFAYWIAKDATDFGRARAEAIMTYFLQNEIAAAARYKLRCMHMTWEKGATGESREMFAYQIFCNDKLCKVFEPVSKTFPTVFLDGIRSIVPRTLPADKAMACIKS